ncbi:site-specific DNA-methyltransferase [Vibrio vulnificus]|uniref:site-specific DNA-methyltransferase n=1 Tax=Vibrio vulnificus TaxID=672 RepID=UPI001CDC84BC|nr:site-specific DNA-methyltransferase [Vibrio vulnificus]MCA4005005.1 site-specific DNA-methyltransferase [Vibrio vulnificus]
MTIEKTMIEKISLDHPESKSADITEGNIQQLKQLFPDVFSEGKIDFEALKAVLGEAVDDSDERYNFTWNGKNQARQIAQTPSTGTLRPCKEESVNWDSTENLFIEGDNLEVLKLLQKSYHSKVKLIYIDPPYNVGKDFVYPDDFSDGVKNYLKITKQVDSEGRKLSTNNESSGRFHSNWLNMIYPRLKLAKNLLQKDGAIFVSCDENEHVRLKAIMGEIFGEENFVADMIWAAGRKNDSRLVSVSHEYIVCYARDAAFLKEKKVLWRQKKKGLEDIYKQVSILRKKHGSDCTSITKDLKDWYKKLADGHPAKGHKHYNTVDKKGVYFPADISWPGGGGPKYEVLHPVTGQPVKTPSRGWMTSDQEKMKQWIREDKVHFGIDETSVPCIKSYLKDKEYEVPYSVFYQDGRAATKRLRALMGGDYFDFPKDELVLQEIVEMVTGENDIIMDFFAGSGTTGHAVMQQNQIDNLGRKFILVQLPEPLDKENKAQKAAAEFCENHSLRPVLSSLTIERLKKAGEQLVQSKASIDFGFKTFSLDETNIRLWDTDFENLEPTLQLAAKSIKDDRTPEDVLHEILLKYGLELTEAVEETMVEGKKVFVVGDGALMVCLDDDITEAVVEGIAKLKQELDTEVTQVVFKDQGFADSVVKTNAIQILKQYDIDDVKSI